MTRNWFRVLALAVAALMAAVTQARGQTEQVDFQPITACVTNASIAR